MAGTEAAEKVPVSLQLGLLDGEYPAPAAPFVQLVCFHSSRALVVLHRVPN